MEGQKHKKKAAAGTTDTKNLAPGTHKCELCDVICTGKEAFNSHVIGASHQKVCLNLVCPNVMLLYNYSNIPQNKSHYFGLKTICKIQQTFDCFISNAPPISLQYQLPGLPLLQLYLCCNGKKMAYK